MTILPKKKQNKNTTSNEDERDNDISPDHYVGYVGHSNGGQGVGGGQLSPQGRNVVGWSSRSEDKRTAPETGHTPIGPSHSKRRHRNARGVDVNPDIQRSLINTVLSLNKSALSSPSNSPRNNLENDSSMPSSSNGRDDNERQHPGSLLIPVNFGSDNCAEEEEEEEEDFSGYNSGDEYAKPDEPMSANDWEEKEHLFERLIRKKGFNIKKMSEDGACLFRAVADQVYGDQEMHSEVRKMCMDYMVKNGDYFSQYVTENFEDYIQRKRSDHIHGNHVEIQALSEIFNRPIQVYHYSAEPINIENCQKTDNEPIRLSYHRNTHYNSVVNPYKATIGVGLGLPAFKPGHAEKSLVEKALRISEQHELEQAMLEDKIRATDWEATNEAIEEQVARESYIEWLKENERRSKKSCATSTLTRFDDETNNNNNNNANNNNSNCNISPRCYSPRSSSSTKGSCSNDHRSSPKRCPINNNNDITENKPRSPSLIPGIDATTSFLHEVHPSLFGLREHEEPDPVVIQALALSQSEYLDSLKQPRNQGANNSDGQSSHQDITHDLTLPSTSSKNF